MKSIARIAVAAVSGTVLAWVVTDFVLYSMFAAGGYTREALVELPPWAFGIIGGSGVAVGVAAALLRDCAPLPGWMRPAVVGGLVGVAAVVLPTLGIACTLGGPSSKGQAPYLHAGLVYVVPLGLSLGPVAGLAAARKRGPHRNAMASGPVSGKTAIPPVHRKK